LHMISGQMGMFLGQMCVMEYPRAIPVAEMKQWCEDDKPGFWDDEFTPAIALRFFDIDEDGNLQAGPRLRILNEKMQQVAPFAFAMPIPARLDLMAQLASEVANEPIPTLAK
jgi:hypothetical protein